MSKIPTDIDLKYPELYETLYDSSVSDKASTAAEKLYARRVKNSKCSKIPLCCIRWKRNGAVQDRLTQVESELKYKKQYMTRFKTIEDFDEQGKLNQKAKDEIEQQKKVIVKLEEQKDVKKQSILSDATSVAFKLLEISNLYF
jgi:hypothetical protein